MGTVLRISKYRPSAAQGKLKLFVSGKRVSLAIVHPYERIFRQVLFVVLTALVLAYLYFVAASVLNIMARKEASTATLTLQTYIADMEGEYFALSHDVSPAHAGSIGLSPVGETTYVYRPGNAATAVTIQPNAI